MIIARPKPYALSDGALTRASTVFVVLALTSSVLLTGAFSSWPLVGYVVALSLAIITGAPLIRQRWGVALAVTVIVGSAFVGSVVAGFAPVGESLAQATWFALVAPVLLLRREITTRALTWALPLYLVNAAVVIFQGIASEAPQRASGIVGNPNPAAGLLVLGTIAALHNPRTRWLAVPLMFALPFTGSRWATAVLLVLLVPMVRFVPARTIAAVAGAALVLSLPFMGDAVQRYRIMSPLDTLERIQREAEGRLALTSPPSLIPQGVHSTQGNDHNVYARVASEEGVIGAVALIALLAYALIVGRGLARLTLIAIVLFGLMDFYMWTPGQLSFALWLALSASVNTQKKVVPE